MDAVPACPNCGRRWPSLSAGTLAGGCPLCLLEFAFTEPVPDLPDAPQLPAHLGPYLIQEELGRGGMGIVYQARHEALNRIVALKVLHGSIARQPGFAERFQREGQVLASLTHPHIVGVHDLGCEAGAYYLAMELVEGRTLRQLLETGPLPWTTAVPLFGQLCDAIQCAHEAGVIHRDIKPENILLASGGREPPDDGASSESATLSGGLRPPLADYRVKVGDFGIAKLVAPGTSKTLTQTDAILGTRCYMAPEQLERDKPVDHRADIYALGVVLYEMLTGELPLGVFAPPSRKAAVDPRLDQVILQALNKDPQQRFASAAAFKAKVLGVRNGPRTAPLRLLLKMTAIAALVLLPVMVLAYRPWAWQSEQREIRLPLHVVEAPDPRVLKGHAGHVWGVSFAQKVPLLASASEDKTVKLWNPESGECLATLKALPGEELGPLCVALAPDGKTLAAAGRENVVRLWDVAQRRERFVLRGHGREVNAVAFAPDGTMLASGSEDHSVIVWDAVTGAIRRKLNSPADPGSMQPILAVAFSPDGTRLAAGLKNGAIKMWDLATGTAVPISWGHQKRIWAVAFSPDGTLLASGSHDEQIKLWDTGRTTQVPRMLADGPQVWALAFAPDGRTLASGSQDGIVRLWDVARAAPTAKLTGHTDKVVSVAFAPDGKTLASGSWDQTVRLWHIPGRAE